MQELPALGEKNHPKQQQANKQTKTLQKTQTTNHQKNPHIPPSYNVVKFCFPGQINKNYAQLLVCMLLPFSPTISVLSCMHEAVHSAMFSVLQKSNQMLNVHQSSEYCQQEVPMILRMI